jgi:hypothetical protein
LRERRLAKSHAAGRTPVAGAATPAPSRRRRSAADARRERLEQRADRTFQPPDDEREERRPDEHAEGISLPSARQTSVSRSGAGAVARELDVRAEYIDLTSRAVP